MTDYSNADLILTYQIFNILEEYAIFTQNIQEFSFVPLQLSWYSFGDQTNVQHSRFDRKRNTSTLVRYFKTSLIVWNIQDVIRWSINFLLGKLRDIVGHRIYLNRIKMICNLFRIRWHCITLLYNFGYANVSFSSLYKVPEQFCIAVETFLLLVISSVS